MVESIQSGNSSQIVINTLKQAEENGSFKKATEYQWVTLDEVLAKLSSFETIEQQIQLLQEEYCCLYFLVSKALGIDTIEYMNFCQSFGDDPELYVYYIQGWIIPLLDVLRAENKIKQGTTTVRQEGTRPYKGEIDENNEAHGYGKTDENQHPRYNEQFTGMWQNNKPHGILVEEHSNEFGTTKWHREYKNGIIFGRQTGYRLDIMKIGQYVGRRNKVECEDFYKEGKILFALQHAKAKFIEKRNASSVELLKGLDKIVGSEQSHE